MKKLSREKVLHLKDELIYIEHEFMGNWIDYVDGVFTLYDLNYLYLTKLDAWLDCDTYEKTWVAYSFEPVGEER